MLIFCMDFIKLIYIIPFYFLSTGNSFSNDLPNIASDKEFLIDKNYDIKKIKEFGFSEVMIKKIWKMVKNTEFKRYQSAIGPKVSKMSFDKDRRFPITNKFSV